MAVFSTGPIENQRVGDGNRETTRVVARIINTSAKYANVLIEGYALNGVRQLYAIEAFSIAPQQSITKEYFADLDGYEFTLQTSGEAHDSLEVSFWGKNQDNLLVAAHRLVNEETTLPIGLTPDNPIFAETLSVNTFERPNVIQFTATEAAQDGKLYRVTSGSQQIFGNGFLAIEIINPADNPNTLSIARVGGGTPQNSILQFFYNSVLSGNKIPLTPVNQRVGFPRASLTQCSYTITNENSISGGQLSLDYTQSGIGGILIIDYEGRIVVPPGNTITFLLENSSGGVSVGSLTIAFAEYEIPVPELP